MKYFALRSNGYLIYVGEHENFDEVAEYCDKELSGVVWIADSEAAKQWTQELINYLLVS